MNQQHQFYRGIKQRKKNNFILIVVLIFLLIFLIGFAVNAQELFKPGKYTKGQETLDMYGSVWKANVNMGLAVSPPSQGQYWSYVRKIATVDPTNTPEQNSVAIESYINNLPQGHAGSLYIPSGDYYFSRSIKIQGKPIHLFGDNGTMWGYGTRLFFPDGQDGILVDRVNGFQETIIENICVIAQGKTIPWKSGVRSTGRITLRGVYVKGFSHNGIDIWANIEGEGTDASGSYIEKCFSAENGHDGFFAGRVDAQAITYIGCDARDNGQYGFNDDSFLGNTYISCMNHYNKMGDFFVRDKGNARSTFIGCYTEGGSKPSQLNKLSFVGGGIWASGYDKNDGKGIIYQ